jgi:adenosine deaminase
VTAGLIDDQLLQTVKALPKVELHRHLEGAVRLQTLIDVAEEYGIEMPEYDVETLRPFVQMMPNEARDWKHFLAKFQTLRQFYRSPEVIKRVVDEVIADAAADNIRYMELRFTPQALSNIIKSSFEDVVSWVCESASQAEKKYNIQARLIVSMNRHEGVEIGEKVLQAALDHCGHGVVAIDLAGQEAGQSSQPFRPLFERAKAAGLRVTVHAGEWGGAENVLEAIEHLGADRIGHGIRAMGHFRAMAILTRRSIALEVCPTSNVHSGVVRDLELHPITQLFRQGVPVTINTDDPLVSNITLSDELFRAVKYMSLSLEDVKALMLTAVKSSFLPSAERQALVDQFRMWLETPAAVK